MKTMDTEDSPRCFTEESSVPGYYTVWIGSHGRLEKIVVPLFTW